MSVRPAANGTWPRELLVLRRGDGYLRVHVPPLLYAPTLQTRLEQALGELRGVRRVLCDRRRARLSVFFDRAATADEPLLVAVRSAARPYLERMAPEPFAAALAEQHEARRERLQGKATQGVYLGLLGWAHWHVLRWAVRYPVRAWWVWPLVGFGVYSHRRQIRRIPEL